MAATPRAALIAVGSYSIRIRVRATTLHVQPGSCGPPLKPLIAISYAPATCCSSASRGKCLTWVCTSVSDASSMHPRRDDRSLTDVQTHVRHFPLDAEEQQ